jgi:hypothetical protein
MTMNGDLRFRGTVKFDGEAQEWSPALGILSRWSGPDQGHSWVWAHCNTFVDDSGQPVPFIFEGRSARMLLMGQIPGPQISAFYFFHKGEAHVFNSLLDSLKIRSTHSNTEWRFQADRGDLSFRGLIRAEHRDFAGLTYEDTNGSLIYVASSELSDLSVHVYRRGKLEASYLSAGTASFEVASRSRNPYVPVLI